MTVETFEPLIRKVVDKALAYLDNVEEKWFEPSYENRHENVCPGDVAARDSF